MKKYEELENKIKELQEEVDKLKNEEQNKRWRAEKSEYYYILLGNDIVGNIEYFEDYDNYKYKTRNYFKTTEEAKYRLKLINIHYKIMDIADELGRPSKEDWENKEKFKYFLYLDTEDNLITVNFNQIQKRQGAIYCLSEKFKEECIKQIGEEDLKDYLMNWEG